MEERYKLFHNIILKLGETGVLSDIILVGSWCLHMYKLVLDPNYVVRFTTNDIDFLIPNPPKIKHPVDIPEILKELGFIEKFSIISDNSKFVHEEILMEFITSEKGRGRSKPYKIKELNVNAPGLRYVSLLEKYTMKIIYHDIEVTVPEPAAFVLHKYQISKKRDKPGKSESDLNAALNLGNYLITDPIHKEKIISIYNDLPRKWKKDLLKIINEHSIELYGILKN